MSRKKELRQQVNDQRLAVIALTEVIGRVIEATYSGAEDWTDDDVEGWHKTLDSVRALCDEPKTEIFGMQAVAHEDISQGVILISPERDTTSRYWIDLKSGDGYGTDDLNDVGKAYDCGSVKNAIDRKTGRFLVFNATLEDVQRNPFSPLYQDAA